MSRVAGESPEADIAVGLGDRVELPCRLSDFSSILRWYYTPTGLEEDEVLLYTTENPDDIATGYSIGELTFPDDGQRNLIIETLSGNNAGKPDKGFLLLHVLMCQVHCMYPSFCTVQMRIEFVGILFQALDLAQHS